MNKSVWVTNAVSIETFKNEHYQVRVSNISQKFYRRILSSINASKYEIEMQKNDLILKSKNLRDANLLYNKLNKIK